MPRVLSPLLSAALTRGAARRGGGGEPAVGVSPRLPRRACLSGLRWRLRSSEGAPLLRFNRNEWEPAGKCAPTLGAQPLGPPAGAGQGGVAQQPIAAPPAKSSAQSGEGDGPAGRSRALARCALPGNSTLAGERARELRPRETEESAGSQQPRPAPFFGPLGDGEGDPLGRRSSPQVQSGTPGGSSPIPACLRS